MGINKNIKCDVESCKYNSTNDSNCTLKEIKVTALNDSSDACKKETICDSFKEKNS